MGIGRRIALVEIKTKGRSRMEYTILDHASDDNIIDDPQETSSPWSRRKRVKKGRARGGFCSKSGQNKTSSAFFFLRKKKKFSRNFKAQTAFLPFFSPPPLSRLIKAIFHVFAREGGGEEVYVFSHFRAVDGRLLFSNFHPEIKPWMTIVVVKIVLFAAPVRNDVFRRRNHASRKRNRWRFKNRHRLTVSPTASPNGCPEPGYPIFLRG